MNNRDGKRPTRAVQRFLRQRVQWSPWFRRYLEGQCLMRRTLARGAAHRRKHDRPCPRSAQGAGH